MSMFSLITQGEPFLGREGVHLAMHLRKTWRALVHVAQLVEHHPMHQKVANSISGQGTCLGCLILR